LDVGRVNVSKQRIAATISLFIEVISGLLSMREITKRAAPTRFGPNSPPTSIQIVFRGV
jgi:hypothetical protein